MISVSRLNVGPFGFISPLCNLCVTKDCTNPIETMNISVTGVVRKVRLYNRGNEPKVVVECEGCIIK
jgi:hypothetical protein